LAGGTILAPKKDRYDVYEILLREDYSTEAYVVGYEVQLKLDDYSCDVKSKRRISDEKIDSFNIKQ
jgi:hypothetical protein